MHRADQRTVGDMVLGWAGGTGVLDTAFTMLRISNRQVWTTHSSEQQRGLNIRLLWATDRSEQQTSSEQQKGLNNRQVWTIDCSGQQTSSEQQKGLNNRQVWTIDCSEQQTDLTNRLHLWCYLSLTQHKLSSSSTVLSKGPPVSETALLLKSPDGSLSFWWGHR